MRFYCSLAATLLLLSTVLEARTKKVAQVKAPPQDEIEVVGHIPLAGGPVRRFMATQHFSSHYLYAEHDSGSNVTLIDVSRVARPAVLGEVAVPFTGRLDTVAGTAAMMTESDGNAVPVSAPRTIRILNFSDPQHPVVAREFTGVTATSRDEHRGLIFIANAEGIWILHQKFAEDPELEKAYAHQVVYQ